MDILPSSPGLLLSSLPPLSLFLPSLSYCQPPVEVLPAFISSRTSVCTYSPIPPHTHPHTQTHTHTHMFTYTHLSRLYLSFFSLLTALSLSPFIYKLLFWRRKPLEPVLVCIRCLNGCFDLPPALCLSSHYSHFPLPPASPVLPPSLPLSLAVCSHASERNRKLG